MNNNDDLSLKSSKSNLEDKESSYSLPDSPLGKCYSGRLYTPLIFDNDDLEKYKGETLLFIRHPQDEKRTIHISINLSSEITGMDLKNLIKKNGGLECELSQMKLSCVGKEIKDSDLLKEITHIFFGRRFVDHLKHTHSLTLEITSEEKIQLFEAESTPTPSSYYCITM